MRGRALFRLVGVEAAPANYLQKRLLSQNVDQSNIHIYFLPNEARYTPYFDEIDRAGHYAFATWRQQDRRYVAHFECFSGAALFHDARFSRSGADFEA